MTMGSTSDKDCIFREYCDISDISFDDSDKFSSREDGERNYVYLLNQLLGMQLRRKGIKYNRDFRRNYFPREDEKSLVFKKAWYNLRTKTNAERTTAKYYEYGWRKFWRHIAANFKFRRIGDSWFLQVIPQYLFTYDGTAPCDPDMVGPYTTKIKAVKGDVRAERAITYNVEVILLLVFNAVKALNLWTGKRNL